MLLDLVLVLVYLRGVRVVLSLLVQQHVLPQVALVLPFLPVVLVVLLLFAQVVEEVLVLF